MITAPAPSAPSAAHVRRWRDKGIVAEFVVEWQGRPIKSVKTAWRQAVELAGIEGATPHTLRHTAVTWLKQAGHSSYDVAGFTGMSEAMVERVYGKHDPNYQKDVANRFKPSKPAPPKRLPSIDAYVPPVGEG